MKKIVKLFSLFLVVMFAGCVNDLTSKNSTSDTTKEDEKTATEIVKPDFNTIKDFAKYKAFGIGVVENSTETISRTARTSSPLYIEIDESARLVGELSDGTFELIKFVNSDGEEVEQTWNLYSYRTDDNFAYLGFQPTFTNYISVRGFNYGKKFSNYILDLKNGNLYCLDYTPFEFTDYGNTSYKEDGSGVTFIQGCFIPYEEETEEETTTNDSTNEVVVDDGTEDDTTDDDGDNATDDNTSTNGASFFEVTTEYLEENEAIYSFSIVEQDGKKKLEIKYMFPLDYGFYLHGTKDRYGNFVATGSDFYGHGKLVSCNSIDWHLNVINNTFYSSNNTYVAVKNVYDENGKELNNVYDYKQPSYKLNESGEIVSNTDDLPFVVYAHNLDEYLQLNGMVILSQSDTEFIYVDRINKYTYELSNGDYIRHYSAPPALHKITIDSETGLYTDTKIKDIEALKDKFLLFGYEDSLIYKDSKEGYIYYKLNIETEETETVLDISNYKRIEKQEDKFNYDGDSGSLSDCDETHWYTSNDYNYVRIIGYDENYSKVEYFINYDLTLTTTRKEVNVETVYLTPIA